MCLSEHRGRPPASPERGGAHPHHRPPLPRPHHPHPASTPPSSKVIYRGFHEKSTLSYLGAQG